MDAYAELWEQAEECEFGLSIKTDNVRELTRKLYAARKATGIGDGIRIIQVADEGWIWLVKETVQVLDI